MIGGMRNSKYAGKEGYSNGGMQEEREGRKGGMKEIRYEGKEGFRTGGIHEREGCGTEEIQD